MRLGIFSENGYIFLKEDGGEYSPDYVSKLFSKAVARCSGVPPISFHGMRHSCCAILFQEGKDLATVQHWLGHSKISVTADVYLHVNKRWLNKVGKEIENCWDES